MNMSVRKPVRIFATIGIFLIAITAIAGDKFKYDIEQDDKFLRAHGWNSFQEPSPSRLRFIWELLINEGESK